MTEGLQRKTSVACLLAAVALCGVTGCAPNAPSPAARRSPTPAPTAHILGHRSGAPGSHPAQALMGKPVSIYFSSARLGWLSVLQGGTVQVYDTSDGGYSWHRRLSLPSRGPLCGTLIAPRSGGQQVWVVGEHARTLTLLGAGGGSVTQSRLPQALDMAAQVDFVNHADGWFLYEVVRATGGGASRLYRTTNGGATWAEVPGTITGAQDATGLAFADTRHGLVSTASMTIGSMEIPQTTDGGSTWQTQTLPLAPGTKDAELTAFAPQYTGSSAWLPVVFIAHSQGLYLYEATGSPPVWGHPVLVPGAAVNRYGAAPPWAATSGGLWVSANGGSALIRSTDRGASWKTLLTAARGYSISAIDFVTQQTGFVVETRQTGSENSFEIYRTQNGGSSWSQVSMQLD